ncbi:cation/H(+) antiporter 15-like [Typha latifolia]|uniref:cation/H(+) antiporter 15-like n=1 Tax=Typha latifolia TaxID=4733 RepID=UPI003C2F942A
MEDAGSFLDIGEVNASSTPLICFTPHMITTNGIWRAENPFLYAFPVFLLQLMLIVVVTRTAIFLLRPLGLPRYMSEIVGGFLLGPTVMGRIPKFASYVFPMRSLMLLDALAHLGLVYYIFIIGVEVELDVLRRAGRRSFGFAAVCTLPPFVLGVLSGIAIHRRLHEGTNAPAFAIFLGVAFSATAFSVLSRILAELKLVGTEVGRLAQSAGVLTDWFAWVLLAFSVALAQSNGNVFASLWTVFCGIAFYIASFILARPAVEWLAQRSHTSGEMEECAVLVGVMVSSFVADAVGTHAVFGAFVFGLAVPNGPFGLAIVEKAEQLVVGLLLPVFFAINGLRTDLFAVKDGGAAVFIVLVVFAAALAKVIGSMFVAAMYEMPLQDGASIGLLMNTKGVIELVMLYIARNKMVLGDQSFSVMVVLSVLVTSLVSPVMSSVVKPARRLVFYKRRSIRWPDPDAELRVLACAHTPRDVPALICLLDLCHPTKRSPFFIFVLHLIELSFRASAFLLNTSHNPNRVNTNLNRHLHHSRLQSQVEHITHAFESYEQHAAGVSVISFTAISPYPTMHEDVIAAAEDRHIAIVLLPFHMHQTVDGGMEVFHPAIRSLNDNLLSSSPCTAAILIDRGLAVRRSNPYRVTIVFFGGADDREVLALASRMAAHPAVTLSMLRFVPKDSYSSSSCVEEVREKIMDEECVKEFTERWAKGGVVEYEEKEVGNAEETVSAIRGVERREDLFVVGRGQGMAGSRLTAGMAEWSECPELGPIGDLLASPDFGMEASVLVVRAQGGICGAAVGDGMVALSPESREEAVRVYLDSGSSGGSKDILR